MLESLLHPTDPYADEAEKRRALVFGMWIFLATEALFFGTLFLAYTVLRLNYPEDFRRASHEMSMAFGTVNTFVLLASSFFMARAVNVAREGRKWALAGPLCATAALGLAFLTIKGFEYAYDIRHSTIPGAGLRIAGEAPSLSKSALFESGTFEFQDEAAQIAAALCGARPGLRILDLAAGAGGKSLAFAASMQNRGEILACDVRGEALFELQTRAQRAGATIIKTLPLDHGQPHLVVVEALGRGHAHASHRRVDPDVEVLDVLVDDIDIDAADGEVSASGTHRAPSRVQRDHRACRSHQGAQCVLPS